MTSRILPEHCLRLMSAADRKAIGQATAAEAFSAAEARDERELQEQVASLLGRRDVPFIRPAMFRKSQLPPGWPDFTFAYRGQPLGWECKSAVGKLSDEQIEMHEQMRRNGWQISIIRTLQEAVSILKQIDSMAK